MLKYKEKQDNYWKSFKSTFYKYSNLPKEIEPQYENIIKEAIDINIILTGEKKKDSDEKIKNIDKLIESSFSYKNLNKIEKEWQQKQIDLYFNINQFNIIDNKPKIEEDCGKWLSNSDFQSLIISIEKEINGKGKGKKEEVEEELQHKLNNFFDNTNYKRDIINNDYFFPSPKKGVDERYIYSKETIILLLNIWFLRLSFFIIYLSLYTRCEYYDDNNIIDNLAISYMINRNLNSKNPRTIAFIDNPKEDIRNPDKIYSNQFLNYFVKQRLILINPLIKQEADKSFREILLFDSSIEFYLIYDSWINIPRSQTPQLKYKEEPYKKIINFTNDLLIYKKDITLDQFYKDNKFKELLVTYLNSLSEKQKDELLGNLEKLVPK